MGCVALVVMEAGSEWPGHVGDIETLVALRADEQMPLRATRARVEALSRARHEIQVAVLACNDATDDAASSRRASIAGELLASVRGGRRGKLIVTAPSGRTSPLLRQLLLALAGSLSDQLCGSSATVTLKLTDARDVARVLSWDSNE